MVWDVDSGGRYDYIGTWKSVLPTQLFCEPKTAIRNEVYLKGGKKVSTELKISSLKKVIKLNHWGS